MKLPLAMFLLPLLASFASCQLPRSDQAASSNGMMEEGGRPVAKIALNQSRPDELMLEEHAFESEAKERDDLATRESRSLTSQSVRECMEEETDLFGETTFGKFYNGTVSVTASGKNCLVWAETNSAHFHGIWKWVGEHNYCRNPDTDPKGPWCFPDDPDDTTKEYCSIPLCSELIGVGLIRVLDFQDIRYDDFYSTAELDFVPGDSFTICSSDI